MPPQQPLQFFPIASHSPSTRVRRFINANQHSRINVYVGTFITSTYHKLPDSDPNMRLRLLPSCWPANGFIIALLFLISSNKWSLTTRSVAGNAKYASQEKEEGRLLFIFKTHSSSLIGGCCIIISGGYWNVWWQYLIMDGWMHPFYFIIYK